MEHKFDNFRTRVNKIKKAYQEDEGKLNHLFYFFVCRKYPSLTFTNWWGRFHAKKASVDASRTNLTNRRASGSTRDDEGDLDGTEIGESEEGTMCVFQPIHLTFLWTDPYSTTKCVSVEILLPSGVGTSDYSTIVREIGRKLEVSITWPEALNFVLTNHLKCLGVAEYKGMETYYPKILWVDESVKRSAWEGEG